MTRLGFLLPSVNAVLEPDVARLLAGDEELTGHFQRVLLPRNTEAEIAAMIDRVEAPASELADAGVDVLGFACTAGGLIGGSGHDRRIAELIGARTGLPATTTITAVVLALRTMAMRRIVLVTPYEQWLVDREAAFLREAGFEVVADVALGLPEPRDCEAVTPERIHRIVLDADLPQADGAFVSCADFQALAAVEAIERDLGKPVVTSNQAIFWDVLRQAGSERAFEGFGRLLRRPDLAGGRS
jgi:maleate isomerase